MHIKHPAPPIVAAGGRTGAVLLASALVATLAAKVPATTLQPQSPRHLEGKSR